MASTPSPISVPAELTSQLRLPLGRPEEPNTEPAEVERILVSGLTMPARLSRTWEDGGAVVGTSPRGGPMPPDRPPQVAIVGTRRPTHDGLRLAGMIAQGLAEGHARI